MCQNMQGLMRTYKYSIARVQWSIVKDGIEHPRDQKRRGVLKIMRP